MDTIPIDSASVFIKTVSFQRAIKDATTYNYIVNWDISALLDYYAPYMTIAIDNGVVGAEYYKSYPNYGNFPETPQPPEGYTTMYGRFKPADSTFSFQSDQDLMPFMYMEYTVKSYSHFDIRVLLIITSK
jgi:hypothetical protein